MNTSSNDDETLLIDLRNSSRNGSDIVLLFNLITQRLNWDRSTPPRLFIGKIFHEAFGLSLNGIRLTKAAIYSLNYSASTGWSESDWDQSELIAEIRSRDF